MGGKVIGFLGYGEIGSSIATIVKEKYEITAQDPKHNLVFDKQFDIMHVSIPFNDRFMEIVSEAIKKHSPKLTIIESTIQFGTTRKLAELTGAKVVHSPCRGVHPNLVAGIRTFVKYIGAMDDKSARMAEEHYNSVGIRTERFNSPEETEIGKLLCTTYYMANIIFCKEVAKLCEELGVDFSNVYTSFNKTYNEGYTELGMKHVVRPVLKPMPGKVGGHCQRPNIEIINRLVKMDYFKRFIEYDESYAGEKKD